MPPARPTLTPLQSLLARATYEEQVARATEARRAKAADTAAVLRGGASEVDRMHKLHKLHRPHSEVVILLNPQEWKWLAQAAEAAGPIPPRIASYLGWRTQ